LNWFDGVDTYQVIRKIERKKKPVIIAGFFVA
jgi:hypothetical protein